MSGLFQQKEYTGKWWVDHSLSIVLAAILFVQTIFILWTGWGDWSAQEVTHGTKNPEFWSAAFWKWWSYEYVVSIVADTYGVILIVLLSKWFYERGSSESK